MDRIRCVLLLLIKKKKEIKHSEMGSVTDERIQCLEEVDGDEHRRGRHAERDGREDPDRPARPGAHQDGLQQAQDLADVGVVGRVVALLPVHPLRRRLVVRLRHLHLVDPLAQHDHALVDELPAAVVPAEGGDDDSAGG